MIAKLVKESLAISVSKLGSFYHVMSWSLPGSTQALAGPRDASDASSNYSVCRPNLQYTSTCKTTTPLSY